MKSIHHRADVGKLLSELRRLKAVEMENARRCHMPEHRKHFAMLARYYGRLITAGVAVVLSGCATIERHPYISAFVATSIIVTATAHGHGVREPQMSTPLTAPPEFTTQPVNCAVSECR